MEGHGRWGSAALPACITWEIGLDKGLGWKGPRRGSCMDMGGGDPQQFCQLISYGWSDHIRAQA